jgi:hypothetical protein
VRTAVDAEKKLRDMQSPDDHTAAASTLVTTTIVCVECLRPWLDESERWRLKVLDDEVPETVPYCPACAMREFGPL